MPLERAAREGAAMHTYLLTHRHAPAECGIAFAAWRGFPSPLRRETAIASCMAGGHCLWWTIQAEDEEAALAQLPPFLADRTEVVEVRRVAIP